MTGPSTPLPRRSVLGAALAAPPLAALVGAPAHADGTDPVGSVGSDPTGSRADSLAVEGGAPRTSFTPGEPWLDTAGEVIQAHGGQVVPTEDAQGLLYYWYGEDRSNGYGSSPGVHVYSSRDLYSWTDEGLALRALTTAEEIDTPGSRSPTRPPAPSAGSTATGSTTPPRGSRTGSPTTPAWRGT
jgi:hypothetical protein